MARQFQLSPSALLFLKGIRRGGSTQRGVTGRDGSASSAPLPGTKGPRDPQPLFPTPGRRAGTGDGPHSRGKGPPDLGPPLLRGQNGTGNACKLRAELETGWELQRGNRRKTSGMESTRVFLNAVYLKCPAETLPALPSLHTSPPPPLARCSTG